MPVAGGPKLTTTGILLEVDAADKTSYSGTGTTWTNQVRPGTFNGTLNNISFNSTDARGALVFTGSNTFVDFGNLGPSLTSSFSFQVAFKPAATASGQPYTILSYASASATSSITFKLDYTSSNQTVVLTTFSNTGSQNIVYSLSASAASGSWNIVHGTFGTQTAALFINGLNATSVITTGSVVGYNTANRLYAGLNFGSTSGYYTGSVGNIMVNNADLNFQTVNKNYNAIATRFNLPLRSINITDLDALNFIIAASIEDSTQQTAINTLVTNLKTNNLWNKMKAIYPFVGGFASTHKYNLKDPRDSDDAFRLVFFGGWTHTSTGALPNGTNGYANTFLTPSITLLQDDTSIGVYSGTSTAGSQKAMMGAYTLSSPARYIQLYPRWTSDQLFISVNDNANGVVSNTNTSGFIMGSRTSSTARFINLRGVNTDVNLNSTGLPAVPIYLGNINPLDGSAYSNHQFRFSFIGNSLTSAEAITLYNLVQAYQTTLGRQV